MTPLADFRLRYRGLTWDQLGALFGRSGAEAYEDCRMIFTPTSEQQTEIEALIDRGWKTENIRRKTGYSQPLILEARRIRRERLAAERQAREAAHRTPRAAPRKRFCDSGIGLMDDGGLIAALVEHPLYEDATAADIALEDAAWAAGRKVPSLREMRMAA